MFNQSQNLLKCSQKSLIVLIKLNFLNIFLLNLLQVVKMFIIIVTIFAVCWLPYQGFFIFVYHHRHFTESSYVQHVYLSFYWLAMSNSMVNPIIYYWMNNRYCNISYICRLCIKKSWQENAIIIFLKKRLYTNFLKTFFIKSMLNDI